MIAADRSELPPRYDPAAFEPRIAERWLDSGLFSPEPAGEAGDNYSIAIPPPNVTGELHMGHALNITVQDVLIRHHRMRGARTRWILGTDHAGIATQTVIDRQLEAEGTTREALGREVFVARAWEWRERYGGQIVDQLKRLGASCDYRDERFTLDEPYVAAVLRVFVALYERGLVYRDNYLVNWDPGSGSAISDLEVVEREVTDTLYHVDYPLASGSGAITVATVRPETMLADTAIAVHPDDERYARLVGETAILPLVGRRLPIVADDYVKPEFGTGALKVTPGHDAADFELGRRHKLAELTVIGEDGRMTAQAGERFAGLEVLEAREAVVEALRAEERIVRTEAHVHEVPFSHRSGERIEPRISLQWFMRMDELAAPAIAAVRDGRVRFHPPSAATIYLDWMQGIRPWCISRQLWWGHQLPVWYCDACEETYVATHAPDRCGACGGPLRRDPDVLDTWFSSALWPFATLGWPQRTPALRAFYPTDALVTSRDIINLWVARMIVMGLEFLDQPPFSDVYVHSIVQGRDGRRMSKSLGTGVDPLELIEAHGADALRFGMLAMSSTQDVRFSDEKIAQGAQLANKLWNASRLVLGHVDPDVRPEPRPRTVEDRWILSRLHRARSELAERIERFDFAHAALGLYDFVYGALCDWYLELIKPRLYEDGPARADVSATVLHVLTQTLIVAHPLIPFVTEAIWERLPGAEGLLAGVQVDPAAWAGVDEQAERELGVAIEAVQALRGWRERVQAPPGAQIPARLEAEGYDATAAQVARLARIELTADGGAGGVEGQPIASVAVPGGAVAILPNEAVDLGAAERKRDEQRERLRAELARAEGKLADRGFVAKAPADVVARERAKLSRLRAELEALA